ncbi:MAG: hypothetical protein JST64_00285 [Actinobacteria bacterium]|nr:hypothetical protein [Actinomycetota bacterium]
MTDRPPSELEELTSAAVDGEASPDELAALAGDPAAVARASTFRSLTDAHRDLAHHEASTSAGGLDARIAAALAAADEAPVQDPVPAAGGPRAATSNPPDGRPAGVVVIGGSARARAARSRRHLLITVGGIAAAIVVVLVGVVAVRDDRGSSTAAGPPTSESDGYRASRTADSPAALPGGDRPESDQQAGKAAVPQPTSTTTSATTAPLPAPPSVSSGPVTLPWLGTFEDVDQLVAAARQDPGRLSPFDARSLSCPPSVPLVARSTVGSARVGATDVLVVLTDGHVTTTDLATCTILPR